LIFAWHCSGFIEDDCHRYTPQALNSIKPQMI